ncbi:MAG: hypothetical protein ACK2UO_12710 [Caldilineaceae bacterium]
MVDYALNSSTIFRLKRAMPARVLKNAFGHNISIADIDYFRRRVLDRLQRIGMGCHTTWTPGVVELGLAVVHGVDIGDKEQAQYTLNPFGKKFSGIPDTVWSSRRSEAP